MPAGAASTSSAGTGGTSGSSGAAASDSGTVMGADSGSAQDAGTTADAAITNSSRCPATYAALLAAPSPCPSWFGQAHIASRARHADELARGTPQLTCCPRAGYGSAPFQNSRRMLAGLMRWSNAALSLWRGKGCEGTGTSRNSQSGSQPCLTS